ncbi:hypothetical protein Q3G72_021513 [Acer saccharum]|nr:hypothetical protein Q3G72_021513 [Acer saccharum]
MKTIASRLLHSHSQASLPRLYTMALSRNGRLLSTDSNRKNDSFKAEEAEIPDVKSPSVEKLLVLGGNGFVGTHICREALERGLTVSSLSRSGRSSLQDSWADNVVWHQGDLLAPDSLKHKLTGVDSVISCVGGFGSNSHMYKINGTANINAVRAAAEQGVKRFAYISAADFGFINYILRGYYEGKRATERELTTKLPYGGVILRPGFMHGTRRVGKMKLPLSIIGAPLEMILQHAKLLTQIPLIGPLFIPPHSLLVLLMYTVYFNIANKDRPRLGTWSKISYLESPTTHTCAHHDLVRFVQEVT